MQNAHPENSNKSDGKYALDRYTVSQKQSKNDSPYFHSSAPSIDMPKGGGALKGIDEKFTVNAVNGTSELEIAFPLSPSRGDFTPSLKISYNSGSGNSAFGLGWSLSLPEIQRKTDKKLPEYNDAIESDIFLLAGAEDLQPTMLPVAGHWQRDVIEVVVSGITYIVKRYRPRTEGLYAKIEWISRTDRIGSWWKVTTKDNTVTFYGLTNQARLSAPGDASRIFKWMPEVIYDNKGNVQLFNYVIDDNPSFIPATINEANRKNGLSPFTNIYLKSIKYANTVPFGVLYGDVYDISADLPTGTFLMECVLDYGDHNVNNPTPIPDRPFILRADPFSDFHSGFEIRTYRRCERVLMFHYLDEMPVGFPLVRSLDLTYKLGTSPTGYAEADQIIAAKTYGYKVIDGVYTKKALPAMSFDYQPLEWQTEWKIVDEETGKNLPQGLTGPYNWIDLWGEGLPGVLSEQASNGWYYNQNKGGGTFNPAVAVAPKPSFSGFPNVMQWEDLDADGRRQLVSRENGQHGYFELNDNEEWEPFKTFKSVANIQWDSPYTRLLDLDGDGRPDALIAEDTFYTWYKNNGTEGYEQGGRSPIFDNEELSPKLLYNDSIQSIFIADMNGDGLTDIVRIKNGEVCYWPNMGYGKFGARVVMNNAPIFDTPDLFNPSRLSLADVSATGAPDIIYLSDDNNCTIYINYSGNSFAEGVDICPIPGTDQYSKITVIDLLGVGTPCIVWSSPLPQYQAAPMRYIDLMGSKKPYLMTRYNNGLGKQTAIYYRQSTLYYLEDLANGLEWATKLPFPVHCVSSIHTTDSVSQTTYGQTYFYHHGYYDHAEREFRGFGRVDTYDTDTALAYQDGVPEELQQYPVLTKTWYHTGAWMREQTLLDAYAKEYYPLAWAELSDKPEINSIDSAAQMSGIEEQQAYRALKGQMLRQEVYAVDNTALENVPYTVITNAYTIREIQPKENNRFAVFTSYARETLTYSCERNTADPRVAHTLILSVDEYGNVLEQAQVSYPRIATPSTLPIVVSSTQAKLLCAYSVNKYTNDILNNGYHLRVAYESQQWELSGLSLSGDLFTTSELYTQFHSATAIAYTDNAEAGHLQKRPLSCSRSIFYNNAALQALPLGNIQSLALPYQQYTLALDNSVLTNENYYNNEITPAMLAECAYIAEANITTFPSPVSGNYWLPSGTAQISSAHFYLPTSFSDPWNNHTTVVFDDNYLLVKQVTNAIGNTNTVLTYSPYNLQPTRIKDENNNITEVLYDLLGMPVAVAMKGKDDGTEGDTLAGIDPDSSADIALQHLFFTDPESVAKDLLKGATWRTVYNLDNAPVAVGMIAREQHYAVLADSPVMIRISYTDGLGRIAMHKVQGAAAEGTTTNRWIGSGKTVYNNKGNVVMQFEPYYSLTPTFDSAEQAAMAGVSARMHYDALSRVILTELPDGTFTKTEWDSWKQLVYDNNDTVLESQWYAAAIAGTPEQQDAAQKAAKHANTPTVIHIDTLGRGFYTIQHNRYPDPTVWTDHYYATYAALDIIGNRLAVHDNRGNIPMKTSYTMLKAPVRQVSIDSGTALTLVDAAGQPSYNKDTEGRLLHVQYDVLRRPILNEVSFGGEHTVLGRTVYGEDMPDAQTLNLKGRAYKVYDGAGVQLISAYDMNGNALATTRQYTTIATLAPDWSIIADVSLETTGYTNTVTYDALGRITTLQTPEGAVTTHAYDKAGAIYSVGTTNVHSMSSEIVNEIYYDALGQRTKVKYENGTTTTYSYDSNTFRVIRIRTLRNSDSKVLQDLAYWYDPVGNITQQTDAAQQDVYYNGTVVSPDKNYTYDAIYRLIQASGRELAGNNGAPNYNDSSRIGITPEPIAAADTAAMRRYTQYYQYDSVGNMLEQRHTTTLGIGNWTRSYTIADDSNQLIENSIGSNSPVVENYFYDSRGNMTGGMNHLIIMAYNALNQLQEVDVNPHTATYYQYDASGQRVRKVTVNSMSHIREERKYVGQWECYTKQRTDTGTIELERETLHIADDTGHIALIDTPIVLPSGSTEVQLLRYQYSDHLSTATLELDSLAQVISYEEYYPYGSTSFQSGRTGAEVSLKRYRYIGKERDEETGFYYMGARYYVPWLCRWVAVDPMESKFTPQAPYVYCSNNPIGRVDENGMEDEKKNEESVKSDENNKSVSNFDKDFPLEAEYFPSSSTSEMLIDPKYSFSYRWGGSVTRYVDDASGRSYSVLQQNNSAGIQKLYSWVDLKGDAALFNGYNKDVNDNWTGHWVEFKSAEVDAVERANQLADVLGVGLAGTFVSVSAIPIVLEVAATESGGYALQWATDNLLRPDIGFSNAKVLNATSEFFGQVVSNNGDLTKWNPISTFSSLIIGSPVLSTVPGAFVNGSAESIEKKEVIQSGDNALRTILIGSSANILSDKFLGPAIQEIPVYPGMSKWGPSLMSTILNTTSNLLDNKLKDESNINKSK